MTWESGFDDVFEGQVVAQVSFRACHAHCGGNMVVDTRLQTCVPWSDCYNATEGENGQIHRHFGTNWGNTF